MFDRSNACRAGKTGIENIKNDLKPSVVRKNKQICKFMALIVVFKDTRTVSVAVFLLPKTEKIFARKNIKDEICKHLQ